MGPVWDADRSQGSGNPSADQDINYRSYNPRFWRHQTSGDRGTDFFATPTTGGFGTPLWWRFLFNDPDFWQRWVDRWQEFRRDKFSSNHIFAIIDRQVAEITPSLPREYRRWGTVENNAPRNGTLNVNGYSFAFDGTHAGEIRFLKQWYMDRLQFIDTNFLATPRLTLTGGEVMPGTSVELVDVSGKAGTTIYYTLDGTDPRLFGGGISPTALVYSGPITVTDNIRVFARAHNPNHRNIINANCPFGGCPPISTPWSGTTEATYYTHIPALRITEIMFNPQDPPPGNTNDPNNFEYIELKNVGTTPLNLNRFRLRGGIEFDFPNLLLPAGSNVLVVANLAAFQSRYGVNTALIAGVFSNNLANEGERIILEGGLREPIHDFSYNDQWYPMDSGSRSRLSMPMPRSTLGASRRVGGPAAVLVARPGPMIRPHQPSPRSSSMKCLLTVILLRPTTASSCAISPAAWLTSAIGSLPIISASRKSIAFPAAPLWLATA
jgi:hypothetical protein